MGTRIAQALGCFAFVIAVLAIFAWLFLDS